MAKPTEEIAIADDELIEITPRRDEIINYTIRVIVRVNFKTVQRFENYLLKFYLVTMAMAAGWLLCSFWFCVGIEGAAKVPANIEKSPIR